MLIGKSMFYIPISTNDAILVKYYHEFIITVAIHDITHTIYVITIYYQYIQYKSRLSSCLKRVSNFSELA